MIMNDSKLSLKPGAITFNFLKSTEHHLRRICESDKTLATCGDTCTDQFFKFNLKSEANLIFLPTRKTFYANISFEYEQTTNFYLRIHVRF